MKFHVLMVAMLGVASVSVNAKAPLITWERSAEGKPSDFSSLNLADLTAAVVFIRPKTIGSTSESSTNIAINGRYLTSLQAGHYVVDKLCAGDNKISLAPAKALTNDLQVNPITLNFNAQEIRYYYVDVEMAPSFVPTLKQLDEQTALELLENVQRQAHQVDRTNATHCADVEETPAYVAPTYIVPSYVPADVVAPAFASNDADVAIQDEIAPSIHLNIHFAANQSIIKPQYRSEIVRAAEFLRQYPDMMIVVEGHTDSMGDEKYNQILSQRRANAVRQALIDGYGINQQRIMAIGYGESRPIANNSTQEGRQQNRRVTVTVSNAPTNAQ